MKEKEFILSKQKIADDIVELISAEGVALTSGINVNINGTFRVTGKTKDGKVLATELTSQTLTAISTNDENLRLVFRDEKKFRKIYEIITKSKQEKRLQEAVGLFD